MEHLGKCCGSARVAASTTEERTTGDIITIPAAGFQALLGAAYLRAHDRAMAAISRSEEDWSPPPSPSV